MRNTFGNLITTTVFGESHGKTVGAVTDGFPAGIKVSEEAIAEKLYLRRPFGSISTSRREKDEFEILSGVYNGYTNGSPLCIVIPNKDIDDKDYKSIENIPRPSHADYTASVKYGGFADLRGGGHFSGRLTAALTAVGAVANTALNDMGVYIGTHIKKSIDACDRDFSDYKSDIDYLNKKSFAVLDPDAEKKIIEIITSAAENGDSVGGMLETAVIGLECGVGEPWFDGLEGMLSHGLFSVPAIKAVEFGRGFEFSEMYGSAANDAFFSDNGKIGTKTNNNGGINGGISNGMPIIFRCAVKPTPSVSREQDSVNLKTRENCKIKISGRHDPAIFHRARAAVDGITALTILDMILQNRTKL